VLITFVSGRVKNAGTPFTAPDILPDPHHAHGFCLPLQLAPALTRKHFAKTPRLSCIPITKIRGRNLPSFVIFRGCEPSRKHISIPILEILTFVRMRCVCQLAQTF
jgi:hypothetical protein